MPTITHTHCAPYWEQEVSLGLQLSYNFHVLVMRQRSLLLHAVSPTAALAACSFNLSLISPQFLDIANKSLRSETNRCLFP